MKRERDTRNDAVQVDWIVPVASAIGMIVVIAASISAGEHGLAAALLDYVAPTSNEVHAESALPSS